MAPLLEVEDSGRKGVSPHNVLLPHWLTGLRLEERLRLESGFRRYLWSQLVEALGMNETAIMETGVQWKAGGVPEKKPAEKQSKQPELGVSGGQC